MLFKSFGEKRGVKSQKSQNISESLGLGKFSKLGFTYIYGELKYRVIYSCGLITCLVTLIYLNLGLILEFQGSYYFNYFQCTDFMWVEGLKEHTIIFPDGVKRPFHPLEKYRTMPDLFSGPCGNWDFLDFKSFFRPEERFTKASDSLVNPSGRVERGSVELDEFKPFFLSNLNYFSVQDISWGSHGNTQSPRILGLTNISGTPENNTRIPQDYFTIGFYVLSGVISYQAFSFGYPAILQSSRPTLGWGYSMFWVFQSIHFLMLPYMVAFSEELKIECLDSELFFGGQNSLHSVMINCFWLLLFMTYFMAFVGGFLVFLPFSTFQKNLSGNNPHLQLKKK